MHPFDYYQQLKLLEDERERERKNNNEKIQYYNNLINQYNGKNDSNSKDRVKFYTGMKNQLINANKKLDDNINNFNNYRYSLNR